MVETLSSGIKKIEMSSHFDRCTLSDDELKDGIETLFSIYDESPDPKHKMSVAGHAYTGILDLARIGKLDLAKSYIEKFEKKIGYDQIQD